MTLPIEAPGLAIAEAPDRRRLLLRGRGEDRAFAREVRAVFGLDPPLIPCTSSEGEGGRCLWLGPTTWLVETGDREAGLALDRLGAIEIGDARLVLAVRGERARELLAVGTGIDLEPETFPPGRVVGTLFGRIPATLHFIGETTTPGRPCAPLFHLHIDRAASAWFAGWLAAAVRGLDL